MQSKMQGHVYLEHLSSFHRFHPALGLCDAVTPQPVSEEIHVQLDLIDDH